MKTKLFQILRTFNKKELSEFEKFAASPFHNNGRNFVPYVRELKKYHPLFKEEDDIKKKIYYALSGKKDYNAGLVNTTLSRISEMAEEYLSYKAYYKKNLTSRYDYIQELFSRDLFGIAESEMKEYSKLVQLSEGITDELIKGRMDYEILNVQLAFKNDRSLESTRSVINQADYHIRFTIMRLASFLHNLRVNNIIFNAEYDKTFIRSYMGSLDLENMYRKLKENEGLNELDDVIMIYVLWILGLTKTDSEEYFYEMKEQVIKHLDKFHHHEKYNLFQALEALAWLMQKDISREKYEMELYDISRSRVELNILTPDKTFMRIILFRSILIVSFYKPDWDFIENFVERCIPMLREEHRENMRNFSEAHINYYKGNFGTALEFNNKINFELFAFKYDTRILQFKIYYELDYFEEAHSLIDAHRHFLANNKTVSKHYREMHSNFLLFFSELLKAKQGINKTEIGFLKDKITNTNNVPSKQFLLDKAEEFLSSKPKAPVP
jgi:hypothetical protein